MHPEQEQKKKWRNEILQPQVSDHIKSRISRHNEKNDAKLLEVGTCVLYFETLQIKDSFHQKL